MRSLFVVFAVVCLVSLGFVAPAAAAPQVPTNGTATSTTENTVSVQLSEVVTLSSWEYKDGEFHLKIESELLTDITITDTGDLVRRVESEGSGTYEVSQRRYDLEEGSQTIVFDAQQYRGVAAVTISTKGGGSYLIQSGSLDRGLFSGPFSIGTLQLAVLSASVSVALVIIYKTYRYSKGEDVQPERIA